jgi:holo-[acyl-carrier protein] synthase
MFCLGTDIIEISRIAGACERLGERFINRIYTAGEIAACKGSAPSLAARFAAKEAAMKALGRGFYDIPWTDIEVVSDDSGQPRLKLHGKAAERAAELNVAEYAVSLSHAKEYATAVVLGHRHA